MAYTRNKLTVKAIKNLPIGAHGDGGGLLLRKTGDDTGQWIFRFRLNGRQRQMGLGSLRKVSLAKARKLRGDFEALVADGIDPMAERKRTKQKQLKDSVSLYDVTQIAFEARQAELKDDGKAGRWLSPLRLHVIPQLGMRPVSQISQNEIERTLSPIWHSKSETARKAINRLNIVMKHAAALGLDVDIQAVDKAKALLGKQRHTPSNVPSMNWRDVPDFYASLNVSSPIHLALRLLILNPGPRSKPVRHLRLDHIDDDIWTIPGELLKGRKGKVEDWRVPLTPASCQVIDEAMPFSRNGNLFPNVSGRGVISDSSMSRLMLRRNVTGCPHGFRSSMRTWVADIGLRRDIGELSLAHKIHGRVEASYIRTDFLDDRREMAEMWSQYVTSKL